MVEPPSTGQVLDANGNARPVAFMQGRINSQFINEGFASSFLFCLGALGFILLDSVRG